MAPKITTGHIDSLNDAIYDVVHHSAMPAKAQADILAVSYSRLVNCCVESSEWSHHHTRWIVPQTLATRNYTLLDYLEMQVGRVAVPVTQQQDLFRSSALTSSISSDMMMVAKELGEAASAIQQCIRDGRLTPSEAKRCRKELWDLVRAAVLLHEELKGVQ
jgi:hypothetical protein